MARSKTVAPTSSEAMIDDSPDGLLSLEEALERLKTTRPTFYRWLRSGQIKGHKVGRQWRFYPADLDRFLQGEGPRIDLPLGIGPLLAELGQQILAAGQQPEAVAEDAEGALHRMLQLASVLEAQSLHLEPMLLAPGQPRALLRGRIDGQLRSLANFDRRLLPPLIRQARLMAQLPQRDSEATQPQEGQISFEFRQPERRIEARLMFLSTSLGEAMSATLLDQSQVEAVSLSRLELPEPVERQLREALRRGWGLIVCSGPTGSGKTTTLYAALNEVAGPELRCLALEDPVEWHYPWVSSLPLGEGGFGELLKAAMQTDPDVLMIAELRDAESLRQALAIALSGHLVLTTLHTPDALQALLRLSEVSGNPYSVTEAVSLILNQRLVRKLCPHCRRQGDLDPDTAARLRLALDAQGLSLESETGFWQAVGCELCHAGYRGQIQLSEALALSPPLSQALLAGESPEALRQIRLGLDAPGWLADGLARARKGLTTPEELLRAAGL